MHPQLSSAHSYIYNSQQRSAVFYMIVARSFHHNTRQRSQSDDLSLAHHIIISSAPPSSAQPRCSSAAQRRAVPFPEVPCRALPCGPVLCGDVRCCAVLCRGECFPEYVALILLNRKKNAPPAQPAYSYIPGIAHSSAAPCGAERCRAVPCLALRCGAVSCCAVLSFEYTAISCTRYMMRSTRYTRYRNVYTCFSTRLFSGLSSKVDCPLSVPICFSPSQYKTAPPSRM